MYFLGIGKRIRKFKNDKKKERGGRRRDKNKSGLYDATIK